MYEQLVNQIEEETGQLPPNLPRGVAPEVAAENPDVQAFIAPRLTMLMEIANSFLLTIIDSMESVPYGIRWICKQIRSLTRVRVLPHFPPTFVNSHRNEEEIPRGHGLCYLFPYWGILLPSFHKSCNRDPAGVHAR